MPWWCHIYGGFQFSLGALLLIVAASAAIVEALVVAKARIEAARKASETSSVRGLVEAAVDPIKFFEALKGFLQALKDLPTWIAIFGAGLALVFLAGQHAPVCTPDHNNSGGGDESTSTGSNATQPNTKGS